MAESAFTHGSVLTLERCPHCRVALPTLVRHAAFSTANHAGGNSRFWGVYACRTCGSAVLAGAPEDLAQITELYPGDIAIDAVVPDRARHFLEQARETLSSPDASVMVASSAVDAMLKAKGYKDKEKSLYSRIDKAAENGTITKDMAKWAHQVRLDANPPRHADEEVPPHTTESARLAVEFAEALAEFMFVLPARVTRGVAESAEKALRSVEQSAEK